MRNAGDTGGIVPEEWAKIFDVGGENDAALLARQLVDCRIRKAIEMQVIPNMLYIEMRIKQGI